MGNHISTNFVKNLPLNLSRFLKRKVRRYNVADRADRFLDKMKDTPMKAPTYETTMKQVEELMKTMPEKFNELKEKNEPLYKNLEQVYVSSTGNNVDRFSNERLTRNQFRDPAVSQQDKNDIPEGRYSTTRLEHFVCAHARDPKVYTPDVLADVYKIDTNVMKKILEFVKLHTVIKPTKKEELSIGQKFAKEIMPKDVCSFEDTRILERNIIRAENVMSKFYNQKFEKNPDKLSIDRTLFETLVALKPFTKKLKDEFFPSTVTPDNEENQTKFSKETDQPDESPNIIVPEMVQKDFTKLLDEKEVKTYAKNASLKKTKSFNFEVAAQNSSDDSFKIEEQKSNTKSM